MQLKIYNNENTYVVNGPVYVNETTKIWCGKISDGEFKGAFVKILNYGELDDKAAKNELKNVLREEVNTLKQVSKCSKRVPSVKDYWDDTRESRYVVIMDTMPGVSLRAWLDKHQRDELQAKDIFIRKCLVIQICEIMRDISNKYPVLVHIFIRKCLVIQICEIMRDISNKYPVLVHRDLKPENIFVNFNKETKKWDIYIIDFGCANLNYIRNIGTTNYQAPEQLGIRNTRVSITNKTDIFAIGQIMYEMLLGRVPTIGVEYQYKARQDAWIQIPQLPAYLEKISGVKEMVDIINKMTSFEINDRLTYGDIIRNLKHIKIGKYDGR